MPVTDQENAEYGEYVKQLAVNMGVFDLKDQKTVWHYTDGSGFLGILQSGTMFATQVSALNDSKETEYGTDLFKDAVQAAIAEADDDSAAFLKVVLELVKDEPANPTQGVSKFFVTCFSSAKDDLNQWAKYQRSATGRYAIGFHPAGLNREPNSALYRVIYDRHKQEVAAQEIVEATIGFYKKGLTGDRLNDPELWAHEFFLGLGRMDLQTRAPRKVRFVGIGVRISNRTRTQGCRVSASQVHPEENYPRAISAPGFSLLGQGAVLPTAHRISDDRPRRQSSLY
jgi:hypothetical protein